MSKEKKYREGQRSAETFRALPDRAQEIWFQYCDMSIRNKHYFDLTYPYFMGFAYEECKSPIEVIFNFAFDLVAFSKGYAGFRLIPQYRVKKENSNQFYYVDFVFNAEEIEEMVSIKNTMFKLAIECDGHDFHEKTKEQVTYDNEREYDLKMKGFDVLRFSGSQIYNKPFRCAVQTLMYIKEKIGEIEEQETSNE